MIVTTENEVTGHSIASYLGVVRGIVVRAPSIAQGLLGGLKQLVGGNIHAYVQVCEAAREEAYERMEEHAKQMGADAVIGMSRVIQISPVVVIENSPAVTRLVVC